MFPENYIKRRLLCWCLFFAITTGGVHAQSELSPHSLGAKVLFVDHGRVNSIDSLSITNGIEVFYTNSLKRWLNLAIPAKIGLMNIPEDRNNRQFFSLDGILQFQYYRKGQLLTPYVLVGGSYFWEEVRGISFQVPVGGGINLRLSDNSYINLQGEFRLDSDENRNNGQLGVGYLYRFSAPEPDSDEDGVPDALDRCPQQPGPPEQEGCPDSDGDGVVDAADACPQTAGSAATAGCPDADGDGVRDAEDECPEVSGTLNGCPDTDQDGIRDSEDECPDAAGLESLAGCPDQDDDGLPDGEDDCPEDFGPEDNNGCPVEDSDQDGIPDDEDRCPEDPGSQSADGCPDRDGDGVADATDACPDRAGQLDGCPDTDGDGVSDAEDVCPEEAGPANNKGCPELEEEVREVLDIAMRAVQFETGSATLKRESYDILDQIVEILERYPGYNLRMTGYTDSVGDETTNQILSEQRAKSCNQYLISKGISPDRLSYEGRGEANPIADNDTSGGRRLNRRVEFELYLE